VNRRSPTFFSATFDRDGWQEFFSLLNERIRRGDRETKRRVLKLKYKLKDNLNTPRKISDLKKGKPVTILVELFPWEAEEIVLAVRNASEEVYEEINAALEQDE